MVKVSHTRVLQAGTNRGLSGMKKLLRALKQWTLLIAIVVGAVGHSFFSQFTWLAPWLLASMLLLTFCNHLAARSAVPSSAPHPDEPSNRHEPWPLRADAPVASGHRAGRMHGRPHAHGHGGGHHHRYARRQRGLPRGLCLPEQSRHRRARAAGPAAHRHGADRHALPRNHVQRVHARGAHHAFPPAGRLAHPIRRPQGQRRAAALGHSGLLPVGGDAHHPHGRHL